MSDTVEAIEKLLRQSVREYTGEQGNPTQAWRHQAEWVVANRDKFLALLDYDADDDDDDRATTWNYCGCWKCLEKRSPFVHHFVVCDTCGNKRCPHAADHDLECTHSNEPGQPGSAYDYNSTEAVARRYRAYAEWGQ